MISIPRERGFVDAINVLGTAFMAATFAARYYQR
jgi:hypothetical protein